MSTNFVKLYTNLYFSISIPNLSKMDCQDRGIMHNSPSHNFEWLIKWCGNGFVDVANARIVLIMLRLRVLRRGEIR